LTNVEQRIEKMTALWSTLE